MTKLPALMFYPSDWEGDEIAFCSLAAQGLWLRMMFLMHRSTRYGYLSLPNGSAIPPRVIAAKCGITEQAYLALLEELDSVGKLGRTSDGVIYSRRLVKDAQERAKSRGRMSDWRKSKKVKNNCNDFVTPSVTPPVTTLLPLSSVSISTSIKEQAIPPEMVMRGVLSELCLSGKDLSVTLDEICRAEMGKGRNATELRDALIASWRDYEASKPNMTAYTKGPGKFFGDGDWRNKAKWPWKDGKQPAAGRVYVNP